jgi:hypothetical protein
MENYIQILKKTMKTKKLLLTTFAMLLVVLIAGCKKDDFVEIPGVCPLVISTSPANGESNVSLSKVITATFNEKMNPVSFTPSSFVLQGLTKSSKALIEGSLSYNDDLNTVSFTPSSDLVDNTTYVGRINSTVKDMRGNALQVDYVWTFSTGNLIVPTVITTDPANNDAAVVLNKTVTATFSVPMDPLSVTATNFTLKEGLTSIPGVVTYAGSTASFDPTANLSEGTLYTATLTTGVKNVSGVFLATDYVWTFTTGTIIAPAVLSTDPLNNASNVVLNKTVTANFSSKMDPLTITATTFTVKDGATSVAGVVSYTDSTASFDPTSDLVAGKVYTATLTSGIKNASGVNMANDFVWTFSTAAPLGPLAPDLKTVERFGIIAYSSVTNNAGFSEIHDLDVGIYPGTRGSITGFNVIDGGPGIIVNGDFYASDDGAVTAALLIQATQDLVDAYLYAEGATAPAPATVSGNLGGLTLAPGIWKSTSSLSIDGADLTLDAQGDANAVWIFQISSTLITTAGGNVKLIGGAQAKNVYWQVGSSATIGGYTSFYGNILALISITMGDHATAQGRMLTQTGAVTLTSTNIITKP